MLEIGFKDDKSLWSTYKIFYQTEDNVWNVAAY